MKHRMVILITMLLTAVVTSAGKKQDDKVVMCVDTVEIELDVTYTDNPYRSFEIVYWNSGKGKLEIDSVLTGCHCTAVKYDKVALKHDKRSALSVDVDMSMFGTGRYFGDIFVYYNGRKEPFEIHFTGLLYRKEDVQ